MKSPFDGWAVSGTNCTIRGTMSDETGTIVAQVVNGDGTTNVINGIVERNGNFWLENVPLNGIELDTPTIGRTMPTKFAWRKTDTGLASRLRTK